MSELITTIHRTICGEASGCYGPVCIPSPKYQGAYSQIDLLEDIAGVMLLEGDTVRITVEVIEKGPGLAKTNPWHHQNRRGWPLSRAHDRNDEPYDCPCIHTVEAGDQVRP